MLHPLLHKLFLPLGIQAGGEGVVGAEGSAKGGQPPCVCRALTALKPALRAQVLTLWHTVQHAKMKGAGFMFFLFRKALR